MKSILFLACLAAAATDKTAIAETLIAEAAPSETAGVTPPLTTQSEATQPNTAPESTLGTAQDSNNISYTLETDFNSRYVFRGLGYSEGAVAQPSLYLTKGPYTLGFWGNYNATRRGGQRRQMNEVDVTLTKTIERGNTTLEPALLMYLSPTDDFPTTGEFSFGVAQSFKNFGLFSNHTVDFLQYEGAYFGEIGLSREQEYSPSLSGEAKLSLGVGNPKFNEVNIGPRKWAFNVAALDLSLTKTLGEKYYLRPHFGLTHILDGELKDNVNDATIWNFGLAIGSNF